MYLNQSLSRTKHPQKILHYHPSLLPTLLLNLNNYLPKLHQTYHLKLTNLPIPLKPIQFLLVMMTSALLFATSSKPTHLHPQTPTLQTTRPILHFLKTCPKLTYLINSLMTQTPLSLTSRKITLMIQYISQPWLIVTVLIKPLLLLPQYLQNIS